MYKMNTNSQMITNSSTDQAQTNIQEALQNLHPTVVKTLALMQESNYEIITPIDTITSTKKKIDYICNPCGETKNKMLRDIPTTDEDGELVLGCRTCKTILLNEKPRSEEPLKKALNKMSDVLPNEQWKPIVGGWISSHGKAVSSLGKVLLLDPLRDRYTIGGKAQYRARLIAEAFGDKVNITENAAVQKEQVKLVEEVKPSTKTEKLCVTIIDKSKPFCVDNLQLVTHKEACANGRGPRTTDRFKEAIQTSIFDKISSGVEYKIVPELPDHLIFKDGKIFNKKMILGGNRFLAFSETKENYLHFASGNKNFYVNRLVCMAFHPMEGKNEYKDYKGLECNHKDGNTLNNHADNLEWVTHSQNIQHAYDTKLNKKVRSVLQYAINEDKSQGNFIAEFTSIAEACRQTNIPEHRIRETANGKTKPKEFIWKFKDESISEEWSKKFSSKPKAKGKIVMPSTQDA